MTTTSWNQHSFRLLISIATCSPVLGEQARLEPIGVLPGGYTASFAFDISANGEVVVGYCDATGNVGQAFRWTLKDGIEALPWLTPGVDQRSDAYAVSADGSVIVGRVSQTGGTNSTAVRWENGIPMSLGALCTDNPYGSGSYAWDVSSDGQIVVGYSNSCGFRWTAKTGIQPIPTPAGFPGTSCDARAISGDGTTIVGSCGACGAYRWTEGADPQSQHFPGAVYTVVTAVSYDGQVLFGNYNLPFGTRSFRWTPSEGFQDLGQLPDQSGSTNVEDCSSDGSMVVGTYYALDGDNAFVWSESTGLQSLRDILTDGGAELCDWRLWNASSVSANGTRIVGYADDPGPMLYDGYVAFLSDAPMECCNGCDDGNSCTADTCVSGFCEHTPVVHGDLAPCGGDGKVDIDDLISLLEAFKGNSLCACTP
ncbi:MAG: hypothetical protein AABZ47_05680 [Planctomycetota bacterium]